jgi:glyoxalase superfamily protein
MARIQDIVFDCAHPASLARFWAAVLDEYAVAAYEEADLEQLRSLGVTDPEDDPTVLVETPGQPGRTPRLWFQQVPEGKTVKNRMHLDLRADDPEAEIDRLVDLGATVLARYEGQVVLADPEGSEFCLLR